MAELKQKIYLASQEALNAHVNNADVHVTTQNKEDWDAAKTHADSNHARVDATKVEKSQTNGNIVVDEQEMNVYTHPEYTAKDADLYKVAVDATGHVNSTTAVTKEDIAALGVAITDTTYEEATQSEAGLMSAEDKTKLDGVAENANNYVHPESGVEAGTYKSVTVDAKGHVTSGTNPATIAEFGITDAYTKTEVEGELAKKANSNDAALTGTPTAPTAVKGTSTTQIATTEFVSTAISEAIAASDAMVFKGTVGTDGTVTVLPTDGVVVGDTYKVITALTVPAETSFTGAEAAATIGDLVVAMPDGKWIVVPSGDEDVTTVKYSTSAGDVTLDTSAKTGSIVVGEAAIKQVDSTIDDESKSTNLPTSAAVAAFVEGKGYVTTDTTYEDATESVSGLMSASDKTKLNKVQYTFGEDENGIFMELLV